MASDRLSSLVGLCAAPLAIAVSLPPTASADTPSWSGEYAITFMVGPKDGTSMAAGDPEVPAHGYLRIPIKLYERKMHRHDRQRPSAEQSDGSATGAIHMGRVVLDASQRFSMGLHDARHHDPMESGPIQCALHARSQRNTCRRHAHRHLERPVPGLDRDGHDGRARMTVRGAFNESVKHFATLVSPMRPFSFRVLDKNTL